MDQANGRELTAAVLWVLFLVGAFLLIGVRDRRPQSGRYGLILLVSAATLAVVYIRFPPS